MQINSNFWLYALPVIAGVLFGFMGYLYQGGARRGVTLPMIAVYLGAGGCVFFGARCRAMPWAQVPALVWTLGSVSALGQLALTWGVRKALKIGPLSPVWLAMNLSFVLVILYAWLFLGEALGAGQAGAALAGVAAVALGAGLQHPDSAAASTDSAVSVVLPLDNGDSVAVEESPALSVPPSAPAPSPAPGRAAAHPVFYGALLFAMLAANSVMHISLKILNTQTLPTGERIMDRFGDVFLLLIYTGLFFPLAAMYAALRRRALLAPRTLAYGLSAAACSVGGLWMLGVSARLPAAYTFTVSGVVNILLAGLISVFLFQEKASRGWFAMMSCALLSLALLSLA